MKGGKKGKIEEAHLGTLFLNEIGELPLGMQTHILGFFDNNEVTKIGGTTPRRIDVRIIAATNRNLKERVQAGAFRRDLYYRLNIIDIDMPALRFRRDDIPVLATHFLAVLGDEYGLPDRVFTEEAIDLLCGHNWPGNVRELKNLVAKTLITCSDLELDFDSVKNALPNGADQIDTSLNPSTLEDYEKIAVINALKESNGVISKAALTLKVSRATLHNKIRQYNISVSNIANIVTTSP